MLYTVDRINMENKILPNIPLGVHVLDDCDKDTYGLEQSVEFIKGEPHPSSSDLNSFRN
jgi:metabotropic X receptor